MAVEEPRFGGAAGGRGRAQAGEDADHRAVNRLQQKTEAGWTLNFCFIFITDASVAAAAGRRIFTLLESLLLTTSTHGEKMAES